MFGTLLRGAVAGAAGTTALNAVTYLDMALRARPASSTPEQAVDEIARRSGHPVPGDGKERERRLAGMGPLAGIATGVGVGIAAGLLRPLLFRLPATAGAIAVGGAAMAASDAPLTALGLTDPKSWSGTQWLADVLPHLTYGAITVGVLRRWGPPRGSVEKS
jgi:hypothetical protein